MKKILPSRDSIIKQVFENYLLKDFKNHAADLTPVVVLFISRQRVGRVAATEINIVTNVNRKLLPTNPPSFFIDLLSVFSGRSCCSSLRMEGSLVSFVMDFYCFKSSLWFCHRLLWFCRRPSDGSFLAWGILLRVASSLGLALLAE